MSRRFFHPLILAVILVLMAVPLRAQDYGPLVATDEYKAAERLRERFAFQEAVNAFNRIAEQNPRTTLGAISKLRAGEIQRKHLGDSAAAIQTWQEASALFAGSRFEINARLNVIVASGKALEFPDPYLAAVDALSVEFGGPSIVAITSGTFEDAGLAAPAFRALSPEQFKGLRMVFMDAQRVLTWTTGKSEQAVKLGIFNRSVHQHDEEWSEDAYRFLSVAATVLKFGKPPGEGPRTDPQIVERFPEDRSTVAGESLLRVRVAGSDILGEGMSLPEIQFQLDGQDIKPASELSLSYDLDVQRGRPFETVTLEYTPTAPLGSGSHSVRVVVPNISYDGEGPGRVDSEWTFIVSDSPPSPSTRRLPATRDSILSAQNPHRNEGANPVLQLSHRPEERNKANNPIVAFDLSNVNLSAVTKATLVLDVQECELPKKWGPEGRNILAYPVNESWVEGNGQTIRVGQGEQTRGSGQGVTWFSPVDANIANKSPNGALQWMGARPFLGPLTAPPVQVVNKQTGPISFDVTQDVRSAFDDGWLIRKQDESAFGNVRFHSKERGATLGPRLILEFEGTAVENSGFRAVALGRDDLFETLTDLGAQAGAGLASSSPFLQLGQMAYSSWVLAMDDESWGPQRPLSSLDWTRG